MSEIEFFAKVSRAAIHDPRVSRDELAVLCFLASHANKGVCWPSLQTIAAFMDVGERQAQRYVRRLRELGYISVEPRPGARPSRWPATQFRLHYPRGDATPHDASEPVDATPHDASEPVDATPHDASTDQVTRQISTVDATKTDGLLRHPGCHPNKTRNKSQNKTTRAGARGVAATPSDGGGGGAGDGGPSPPPPPRRGEYERVERILGLGPWWMTAEQTEWWRLQGQIAHDQRINGNAGLWDKFAGEFRKFCHHQPWEFGGRRSPRAPAGT